MLRDHIQSFEQSLRTGLTVYYFHEYICDNTCVSFQVLFTAKSLIHNKTSFHTHTLQTSWPKISEKSMYKLMCSINNTISTVQLQKHGYSERQLYKQIICMYIRESFLRRRWPAVSNNRIFALISEITRKHHWFSCQNFLSFPPLNRRNLSEFSFMYCLYPVHFVKLSEGMYHVLDFIIRHGRSPALFKHLAGLGVCV